MPASTTVTVSNRSLYIFWAACIIAMLLMAPYVFGKEADFPLPPKLELVKSYGCTATQSTLDDKTRWFHVHVYADYLIDGRWIKLFAIREGTERDKAFADCKDWLKRMDKAMKGVKPDVELQRYRPPPKNLSEEEPKGTRLI